MQFLLTRLTLRSQQTMASNFFASSAMFFSTAEAATTKSPKSKKKAKSESVAVQTQPLSQNYIIKNGYLLPKPPKRPANPYALYVREKLKTSVGSTLTKDATAFSKQYKDQNVDSALKKRLQAEHDVSQKEYELQRQQYESQYGIPKGHITAWTLFVKEYKSSQETAHKATARMKEAATKWSALGEAEKKEYEKRALELNEKASQESERFRQKFQIPDDPKRSGYNVFVSEFSQQAVDNDKIKASDRIKQASEQWNKLSPEEKEKYVAHAEKQNQKRLVSKESFCQRVGITVEQLQELEDKYKAARKQVIEQLQEKEESGQEKKEEKEEVKASAGRKQKTTRSASPAASSTRKRATSVKSTQKATTTKARAKSATPRKAATTPRKTAATSKPKKAATSKSVSRKTQTEDDKIKPKRARAASAGTASKKQARKQKA